MFKELTYSCMYFIAFLLYMAQDVLMLHYVTRLFENDDMAKATMQCNFMNFESEIQKWLHCHLRLKGSKKDIKYYK